MMARNAAALVIVLGLAAPMASARVAGRMIESLSGSPPFSGAANGRGEARAPAGPKEIWDEVAAIHHKIGSLVEGMKSAQGSGKLDAVAAVVEELAAHHLRMHADMSEGGPEATTEGTRRCPTME